VTLQVAIDGGGLGGLAAAPFLRNAHVDVTKPVRFRDQFRASNRGLRNVRNVS
jgi:2-polyprenyl-6-methoxyphenol hydroxylase-like FAD-dependent oxidoreductase